MDGSQEMLRAEFPSVTLIESPENLGFGRANNLGATKAVGKYLFLLNPDTLLLNNAVKFLADYLDQNPKCGVCGGNLFTQDNQPAHSFWELPTIQNELKEFFRVGSPKEFNYTSEPQEVGYITGADLMIRADLFHSLNGFDADFFMYCEEVELCYRAFKAGFSIYSVPDAKIKHFDGQSFSNNWQKRLKLSLEGKKKYYRKTHGKFYASLGCRIYSATIFTRKIAYTIKNLK